MPRETKSNGQKDSLDRFYTQTEIVKKCLQLINFNNYDCIIEPSAGTGSFLKSFPKNTPSFGYDIAPEGEGIEKADWLTLDKSIFSNYNSILICGNPPFGQQSSLAINFFNEASKIANTIAFILPLSFKKDSIQDRLNLNFSLKEELVLEDCFFILKDETKIKVPCVFQVWEKTSVSRKKHKSKLTSNYFSFTTKELADFRIQRVGGNAGKAFFDLNKAISSNYFIKNTSNKTNEDFVNFVNSLSFPSISYTVGPKSLSKGELIQIIEENFENYKKL